MVVGIHAKNKLLMQNIIIVSVSKVNGTKQIHRLRLFCMKANIFLQASSWAAA